MIVRWSVVVVLGIALAGCFGSSYSSQGAPAKDAAVSKLAFSEPVLVATVNGGAEPGIAVGPEGTIYIHSTGGSIWRSQDHGASWVAVSDPASPVVDGPGDADIWVGPDSRVHYVGLVGAQYRVPYQVSTDRGATWSEPVGMEGGDDRAWISGMGKTVLVSSRNIGSSLANPLIPENLEDRGDIFVAASLDGGSSWNSPVHVGDDALAGGPALAPSAGGAAIAFDAQGTIHVATTIDQGASWTDHVVARNPAYGFLWPVVAYDQTGVLYVVYSADPSAIALPDSGINEKRADRARVQAPSVFMSSSSDGGTTWRPPVQVNSAGTTGWYPTIAAGSKGRLLVSWYQHDDGTPRGSQGSDAYVMAAATMDGDAAAPKFLVERVDAHPIYHGPECGEIDPQCQRLLLDFFEVAIDRDGQGLIAYAAANPNQANVLGAVESTPVEIRFVRTAGAYFLDASAIVAPT